MIKNCAVCGKPYSAPPSGRATCSAACSIRYRSMRHMDHHNVWSDDARERLRKKPTPPQLGQGTAAALALPEGQRGPQNRESMVWELIDPDGNHLTVIGLAEWARQNAARFGQRDENAHRIAAGFRQIAQCMRGKTKRTVSTYKGWGLAKLPEDKETQGE